MSKYTPDQEPRTMITESQLADMLDRTYFQTKANLRAFSFDLMGIKVVQDPKPPMTAVEEWIEERRAIHSKGTDVLLRNAYELDREAELWGEDSEAIADAHNMFPRALDALNAVLELHVKETGGTPDGGVADVCSCGVSYWPCATVQAIEGAINHE